MGDQPEQGKKNSDLLRTIVVALICLSIIAWVLYNAYHKEKESPVVTAACNNSCTAQGYPGYDFKWPMFSGPQCTCIGTRQ